LERGEEGNPEKGLGIEWVEDTWKDNGGDNEKENEESIDMLFLQGDSWNGKTEAG